MPKSMIGEVFKIPGCDLGAGGSIWVHYTT